MPEHASLLVLLGIPGIAAAVAVFLAALVRRHAPESFTRFTVGVILWIVVWSLLAQAGVLRRFDAVPPPMAFMFVAVLGAPLALGLSGLGRRLAERVPLSVLVGYQGFRLPLELVMHQAAVEGTMPVQMSYSGLNFDVVTGITAIVVAFVLRRRPSRRLALAWNLLGSILLAAIATIAFLSTPVFQAFGPDRLNVWVTYFPFVHLPVVLVAAALFGHVLVFRACQLR